MKRWQFRLATLFGITLVAAIWSLTIRLALQVPTRNLLRYIPVAVVIAGTVFATWRTIAIVRKWRR